MATWNTACIIAVLGFGTLAAGRVGTVQPGGAVAVLVPPLQAGGMVRAAALGLPVIDIRWNGRLLVLDAREGLEPLSGQGLWLMDATGAWVCASAPAA